ncbi:hypothetical protein NQ318_002123 [Aromia moschata]|uniref:peroxidase n=1 Tax=Aromia moschata TaxID=1265417 RepID=A0AAV8Y084_9CUCU|nr:hypothetical protein NQ318_002123 [Aromia moschata]
MSRSAMLPNSKRKTWKTTKASSLVYEHEKSCQEHELTICAALLLVSLSDADSGVHQDDYNTTAYTRTLPDDIRPIVRRALRFEHEAAHPTGRRQTCTSDERTPCPPMKFRGQRESATTYGTRSGAPGGALPQDAAPDYADAYFQDIIVTIPRISKRMGLATRAPGPPGVTDNKTNNVFMISDPKNPPNNHFRLVLGRIRGKTSGMGLVTRVPGPQVHRGISQPRTSADSLISPLDAASLLQNDPPKNHESVTALLGAWSELLLHDLAGTGNLNTKGCCSEETKDDVECYGMVGRGQCKEYMRTLPSMDMHACEFAVRNQMNLATSYLDASAIYGSTDQQVEKLRTYDAGLVNVSACVLCQKNALYSAILREHNRVAISLAQINRHWPDETVFLESKRIVTAEIQHITYNEYLPIVLGEETIVRSELELKTHGRFSKYSSAQRAGVYNEVAMSALPALLSMLPSSFMNETVETFAEMVDVLITTPAQSPSFHISVPLRKDWDTAALFIHMGRDHGIPSYPQYVQYCKNITFDHPLTFEALKNVSGIKPEYIRALKYMHANPHEVDLLVGALLEDPLPGAVVGSTFNCLLKQQFELLKRTDRFWYENDLPPSSLTTEQLKEIKKVTLAGLLCANTDDLDSVPPKAFVQEDTYLNARISCDQHPLPQMSEWLVMDHMADLSEDMLMDALAKAEHELMQRRKLEYNRWSSVGGINPKSPQGTAASFSKANKNALKLANTSLLFEFASNEIMNSLVRRRRKRQLLDNDADVVISLFRDEISDGLQHVDLGTAVTPDTFEIQLQCIDSGPCDPNYPFRSYTGYCNNLKHPYWGNSLTTFTRLLPSVYDDGISKPRIVGVTGSLLPNPRVISRLIHPDISNLHTRYTLMLMQYAQFLDHDLTMTPIHKGFHESIPDCRRCDSARTVHPECNPSLPGQQRLGPRDQVNQNTAFLDGSQIYGENHCILRDLKGQQGKMNITTHPVRGKDLLPRSDKHPECKSASGYCFIAGDGRASEQPALTVIHTIFLREHNRISDGLRRVNPHWDEDKLFETARKIVIAENQHLTYNEFLPRILGWNAMNLYGLKLQSQGYYKQYDATCNPAIINEFACASFRFGHSLLRPHIPRLSTDYQIVDPPILLRDGFFKTDIMMRENMIDEIARVTNHLFEDKKIPFSGIDLVGLNIQRARDHGVPSYNNFRALCNLKRATSFDDLAREIPPEVIARLKTIYASVDDIDLRLRKCDRFWYENEDPIVRFTEQQLAEIRKVTLAKITCNNLDVVGDMQRAAFDLPSTFLESQGAVPGCIIGSRHVQVGESAFPTPCTSCVCTAEGGSCASLRVTDCRQLLREWSRDAILRDEVCTAQCGFLLQGAVSSSSTLNTDLNPPPLRNTRAHQAKGHRFPHHHVRNVGRFQVPGPVGLHNEVRVNLQPSLGLCQRSQ